MVRISTLLILFFCFFFARGQRQQYYLFVTKDSLLQGVKNQLGEVIIPAGHPYLGHWSAGELVTDSIIDFYGLPKDIVFSFDSIRAAYTANTTYDREGNILYHPFLFDNGADYVQEGARRFVDVNTGKMGLVHPYGNVLIPAQYDFITALREGYVVAYNGIKRKVEAGGEHWSIVADSTKKYTRIVLNRYGEPVSGEEQQSSSADIQLYGDTLYYPPVYAVKDDREKLILQRLESNREVKELFRLTANELALAIFERPTATNGYYIIGTVDGLGFDYLLLTLDGELFHFDYYQPKMKLALYLDRLRKGTP